MTTLRIAVRKFGPFESAIVKQFDDFRRVTGTDATLEAVAMDLNPLHESLFDGGLKSGAWDLAFLNTDWLAEAVKADLLEDLTPHLSQKPISDFPESWSSSLTSLQKFDGGFWGMPYHDGPECLIYRTDLLKAAGVEVPKTWDEFHAAARKLNAPDQDVYGTALALFPDGHNSFYDFCIHIWSRGGEVFDASGRPDFASPAAITAVDFIRTLAADKAAIAPDPRTYDSVQSGMLFASGRVAMMANWFGFAAYADTSPDSKIKGLVDVAPLPAGPGGKSVSLNVFWVLSIAAGSQNKGLAWEFLRHLAKPEMDLLTTTEGAIGVRRSTWADPGVNAQIPYYHRLEWLHEHARELPVHPKLAALSHVIDDMLTEAVTTNAATRDLLAKAQAKAEALL